MSAETILYNGKRYESYKGRMGGEQQLNALFKQYFPDGQVYEQSGYYFFVDLNPKGAEYCAPRYIHAPESAYYHNKIYDSEEIFEKLRKDLIRLTSARAAKSKPDRKTASEHPSRSEHPPRSETEYKHKLEAEHKHKSDHKHQSEDEALSSERELKTVQDILGAEYKIHLMPKPEYMLAVVEKLLKAMKTDPSFKELLSMFKIKKDLDGRPDRFGSPFAGIVIYPHLGKEKAEKLLNKLLALFEGEDMLLGTGETPRFNRAIEKDHEKKTDREGGKAKDQDKDKPKDTNKLIFYAQGGADFKNNLFEETLPDNWLQYVTAHGRHFAWGNPELAVSGSASPESNILSPIERLFLLNENNNPYTVLKITTNTALLETDLKQKLEAFEKKMNSPVAISRQEVAAYNLLSDPKKRAFVDEYLSKSKQKHKPG